MRDKHTRLVIVEDDPQYAESIKDTLTRAFPGATTECVRTEHEFLSRLDDYRTHPPQAFIVDVMLRWTDPAPAMPVPPPEVQEQGFYRAGFRCQRALADDPRTRDVPVIFHTILEESDIDDSLPKHVKYAPKGSDGEELVRQIRSAIQMRA